MRRLVRPTLSKAVEDELDRRQAAADRKRTKGTLRVASEWKCARRTKPLLEVLAALKRMIGQRERCMYCLDSHGTDIDHFWPKAPFPDRLFKWPNLLLSCTECGRFKGDEFPLSAGMPLLIDPTGEDPWLHLDFDPTTGNMVARFDRNSNAWSPKGLETVRLLQLDRRESLAAGYSRTFGRLSSLVQRHLAADDPAEPALVHAIRAADDHGLLAWCFLGGGQHETPFRDLRAQRLDTWNACVTAIQQS